MSTKVYWDKKLLKYSEEEWSDKPSIFAEYATKFFPKTGKILELASGVGQDGRYFASLGYTVVQTDFSETSLEFLNSKRSVPNIEVTPLDMREEFPFEDGIFDVVYCHLGIHYFDDEITKKLFSEIHRVLKGRGVVALLVNSTNDPEIKDLKKVQHKLYQSGDIQKRFFSVEDMKSFTKDFETIVLDNKGTTYKDNAMGVFNLIRYIGKRN